VQPAGVGVQCPAGGEYSGLSSLPGKLPKDGGKLREKVDLGLHALQPQKQGSPQMLVASKWQLGGLASEAHLSHLLGEADTRGWWVERGPI